MKDDILVHREGYVGIVEFNRPHRHNALTWAMYDRISDLMDELEDDDSVKVIVVRGAGSSFSSGFDLDEPLGGDHVEKHRKMMRIAHRSRMKVWNQPKPTIAQIHGYCLGGAHDLALACDIAVAADDAKMGVPEIQFGMGSPFLLMPWIVGIRRVKELLLTGKTYSGREAAEWGIVNYAVSADALGQKVDSLAAELGQIPGPAIVLQKTALRRLIENSGFVSSTESWLELSSVGKLWPSPEVEEFNRKAGQEGMQAALRWRREKYSTPAKDAG
jgi:enoyl-CoA hydratase/carnithine racemase